RSSRGLGGSSEPGARATARWAVASALLSVVGADRRRDAEVDAANETHLLCHELIVDERLPLTEADTLARLVAEQRLRTSRRPRILVVLVRRHAERTRAQP